MKKHKKLIISIIGLIIILAIGYILIAKMHNNKTENNNEIENFKNNSIMYKEEATLTELKKEYIISIGEKFLEDFLSVQLKKFGL